MGLDLKCNGWHFLSNLEKSYELTTYACKFNGTRTEDRAILYTGLRQLCNAQNTKQYHRPLLILNFFCVPPATRYISKAYFLI